MVVGQAAFDTWDSDCDTSMLNHPEDAIMVKGKLIVSDSSNNRVLIWNTIPITNGVAPDMVLGQPDFKTCIDDNSGGVTASTLDYPIGLWSDGEKLIVADADNNRVLIWHTFPTTNGAPADMVIGQLTMDDDTWRTTQSGLSWPAYVALNGSQMFVSDYSNNRVMVWDSLPAINNAPADVVLGQAAFDTSDSGTSATTMSCPTGLLTSGDKFIVSDNCNNRYLIFESQ